MIDKAISKWKCEDAAQITHNRAVTSLRNDKENT